MPFLFIIIPAFWAMYMAATLIEPALAAMLDVMPLAVPLAIHDYATPLALIAAALGIFGNYCQLSEMLLNRNTARDVIFMFTSAILFMIIFITLPDWPLAVGRCLFALTTTFYPAALFGRAIMDRTETAFSTISLAFLCLSVLLVLTWFIIL